MLPVQHDHRFVLPRQNHPTLGCGHAYVSCVNLYLNAHHSELDYNIVNRVG